MLFCSVLIINSVLLYTSDVRLCIVFVVHFIVTDIINYFSETGAVSITSVKLAEGHEYLYATVAQCSAKARCLLYMSSALALKIRFPHILHVILRTHNY